MDIEIELKFLVSENAAVTLTHWLNQFMTNNPGTVADTGQVHLANTYYDTKDMQFRSNDIGFRTRSTDGVWEQTIKTKGKVVAGVHHRPEYNISLTSSQPQLELFDRQILPPALSTTQLQTQLIALFTTDFKRQIWLIKHPSCSFEMVLDTGLIDSDGETSPINEVELEFKSGDINVLFKFANKLVKHLAKHKHDAAYDGTIRLGFLSKAARGYHLYHGKGLTVKNYLGQVPLDGRDSIEQAFIKTVEYGLAFMQHHEQCFIDKPGLAALRRFNDGVALIIHAIWQYSMLVSKASAQHYIGELEWILKSFDWVEHGWQLEALLSKTGKYRKRLELNSALSQLVDEEESKEPDLNEIGLFFSKPRYNQFLLDISHWLMNKGWRSSGDLNLSVGSQGTLQLLSCDMLSGGWRSLMHIMARQEFMTVADHIKHHSQLKRSLLTGSCVGGLYSESIRNGFRMPWLDLSSGIDELKTLDLLRSLAEQVDAKESNATLNWLHQQTDSLLHAMEQSRKLAVKMKPYWTTTV